MTKRVAVVTGAARGIGKAIAERLLRDGFIVAIADLNEPEAQATSRQLAGTDSDKVFAIYVDVTDSASVRQMVDTVLARAGQIDVLVNNAGIGGPVGPIAACSEEGWLRVMAVNLTGVFLCSKAVLPHMLARGAGRIVNMASIAGKEGNPAMAAYSTSKAGVIGFTKSLAKEVATQGIYVNCVAPALIETELLQQFTEEAINYMVAKIPMGRMGQAQEVAALVAWLASEECTFSTGAVFDVSGGRATY
ncbi:MAG: SDR family oxidoreductase [Caldilineaceae bacterium]|nr:SDR family oxidoreductase [Caldilineaceae bacterium]